MKRLLARLLPLAAMLAFASPAWAGEMTVRGTAIAPDAPGAAPTPTPATAGAAKGTVPPSPFIERAFATGKVKNETKNLRTEKS